MAVGIISGSGMYALPAFEHTHATAVPTPYGEVSVTSGSYAGEELLHIARHGAWGGGPGPRAWISDHLR
jgi:purine nucleoside phosphorylase